MASLFSKTFYDSLEIFFEGNSRTLKQMPNDDLLLCQLKPTVFSLVKKGPVEVKGIDLVRTELNALFSKELESYGIKTSTLKTEDGLILMRKEKVPPIEVIVKGALVGSPKHLYKGIGNTPTRKGEILVNGKRHKPYVRFDWRNPLPEEDTCMPEELANYFINVKQAKKTALEAYERLRDYCLRHELDLQDICFFMNEAGDTICAEVSTDNVRLKYKGNDDKLANLLNSRDQERATERAQEILKLLQKPFLRYPKIIVSGGFCTGKTSLINMLQEALGIPKLIDHTTRPMRPGERDGFPYHFISRKDFEENLAANFYYEWVEFNHHYYGVPQDQVFDTESWTLDILSTSWKNYQNKVPGIVGIFLESPSEEILMKRAHARGDRNENIQKRILHAKEENSKGFDLVIPANTSLEEKFMIVKNFIKCKGDKDETT